MKVINFEDITNLKIPPEQFYHWVEYDLLKKHTTVLPAKISMKQAEQCFCNVMPCILPNEDIMGVKIVNRYPHNIPSLTSQIIIYKQSTGKPLALMDGTYITAMRTGAIAANSIVTFAKNNFKSIGFIGLGNTARSTMSIFADLHKDQEYQIKLFNYKNHAELFKERFKENKNLVFTVYDDVRDIIKNSDVTVSCVTYTDSLFAEDSCYMPGCTIIPVHTRGFQNCDLFFDKVFADDYNHVKDFKYFNQFKNFSETCDVISGQKSGRISDEERILVYNIGISIHDIYFAKKIYSFFEDKSDVLNLTDHIEKYWV